MAATVWKGHLSFGLVSIPVKLIRAARAERFKFHRLNRANYARVRQQLVSDVEPAPEPESPPAPRLLSAASPPWPPAAPLPRAAIVKGYEYEKDRYVPIEDRELETIEPQTSREMEIVEFVRFAEIEKTSAGATVERLKKSIAIARKPVASEVVPAKGKKRRAGGA